MEPVTEKLDNMWRRDMLLHVYDKRLVVIDEKFALYYPT